MKPARILALLGAWLVGFAPLGLIKAEPLEPITDLGPAMVKAETAALLLSHQTGGQIVLTALALPHRSVDAGAPDTRIPTAFLIEVDLASLQAAISATTPVTDSVTPISADLFLYVLGAKRQNLGHVAHRLELRPNTLGSRPLVFAADLALPPGHHQARTLLRIANRAFGLATIPVAIGSNPTSGAATGDSATSDTASNPETALPPLIRQTSQKPWIHYLNGNPDAAPWFLDAENPPRSKVTLGNTDPAATVEVILLGTGSSQPTRRFSLRLTTANGDAPQDLDLVPIPPEPGSEAGITRLTGVLDPVLLAPGSYRLAAFDLDQTAQASPSIEVIVATKTSDPWAALGLDSASSSTLTTGKQPSDSTKNSRRSPKKSALVKGYLEVLEILASGRWNDALDTLVNFEARAIAAGRSKDLRNLEQAEAASLAAIIDKSPAALLPIALLHSRVTAAHHDARRPLLTHHSERVVRGLVEALGDTKAARRTAARVMAGLGLQSQSRGTWLAAQEQFELALEYDPYHLGALLSLGTLKDRRTHFQEADQLFSNLLEKTPDHDETRLRRALCRLRGGKVDGTVQELERLTTSPVSWVAVLAFQELASQLSHSETSEGSPFAASTKVLKQGLERWPGHPLLSLQLAYHLDRLDQIEESAKILAAIDRPAEKNYENERFLYNRWPSQSLENDRIQLREEARARLPDLEKSLHQLPGRKKTRVPSKE